MQRRYNDLKCETVPIDEFAKLKSLLEHKKQEIKYLQTEKLSLEEMLLHYEEQNKKDTKKDNKSDSVDTRLMVYDILVNNIPTKNIPVVLKTCASRHGLSLSEVPARNTVEQMVHELGVYSDLICKEAILHNKSVTLGFDATTQEGIHINSIHLTTRDNYYIMGIDQLAGGTAEDYESHIQDTIDNSVEVYCAFNNGDNDQCREGMIKHIGNTMTDRAIINHATIKI